MTYMSAQPPGLLEGASFSAAEAAIVPLGFAEYDRDLDRRCRIHAGADAPMGQG